MIRMFAKGLEIITQVSDHTICLLDIEVYEFFMDLPVGCGCIVSEYYFLAYIISGTPERFESCDAAPKLERQCSRSGGSCTE